LKTPIAFLEAFHGSLMSVVTGKKKKLVSAAGLRVRVDLPHAGADLRLQVFLVDGKDQELVRIGQVSPYRIGDNVTILEMDQPFNVSIHS
jgi:hypothetical protein